MNRPLPVVSVDILLVEDNPGDVLLIRECMKDLQHLNTLRVVEDGVEAMAALRREGVHVNTPLPDLILLDLNLPRMNGFEVLQAIKADVRLRHIPVVVLTSSKSQKDILKCYNLQASCFVAKPLDLDDFAKVVYGIENFWLTTVCYAAKEQGASCSL